MIMQQSSRTSIPSKLVYEGRNIVQIIVLYYCVGLFQLYIFILLAMRILKGFHQCQTANAAYLKANNI